MYYKVKGKARNSKRKQEIIRENNKKNMETQHSGITSFTMNHEHLLNKLSLASMVKGDKPWTVAPLFSVNM